MKIAVINEDEKSISAHFGQATHCTVFTVEDGQIIGRELREKPHHGADHHHNHEHHHGGGGLFSQILQVIDDCQIVVARGMGKHAYDNLINAGIQPILTDIRDMETAVQAILDDTIQTNPKRIHVH